MARLRLLITVVALVGCANALGQSAASSEDEWPQLIAACNGAAGSTKPRAMRACETLDENGRLSLVETAAIAAYRRYQQGRLEACRRRLASPRGASRGQPSCGS